MGKCLGITVLEDTVTRSLIVLMSRVPMTVTATSTGHSVLCWKHNQMSSAAFPEMENKSWKSLVQSSGPYPHPTPTCILPLTCMVGCIPGKGMLKLCKTTLHS